MVCKGCHSEKQSVFNGEIAIHFPGLEGLDKSIVWVFPKLVVCLHCGFAEFAVPERELQVLTQGSPVEGAVVRFISAVMAAPESKPVKRSSDNTRLISR
jgi:hypothetical protein